MLYAIIGIPLCLVMFQAVGERLNYFTSFSIQFIKKTIRLTNTDVNQTELVCIGGALAILVITGGAALFTHYEGWSYFNSIYYCVITLTTIGFGDFVALQVRISIL
jgi:potassium channel subfamily K protein 9